MYAESIDFGHVLNAFPPQKVQDVTDKREEAIATAFAVIQHEPPPSQSTHTIQIGAREAGLTSLGKHASGNYIGAFFMIIAGPLQQRLAYMGGSANRTIVAALQDPIQAANSLEWAMHVCEAHRAAKATQDSFTAEELYTTDLMAPRGNMICYAGDPSSEVEDLPPTIETNAGSREPSASDATGSRASTTTHNALSRLEQKSHWSAIWSFALTETCGASFILV
jgi:hypothetical protein